MPGTAVDDGPQDESGGLVPPQRRYDSQLLAVREGLGSVDFQDVAAHRSATAGAFADRLCHSDALVDIRDEHVQSGGRALRLRVYTPRTVTGTLLWIHGGAFTVGSPEMDDDLCRDLAAQHALLVVSPDYSLSPEHPFPAAEQDCRSAAQWAGSPEVDDGARSRLLIGGASAGGALALRTALSVIGAGGDVDRLMLAYPVTDPTPTDAMRRYASAPILGGSQATAMWERYLAVLGEKSWPSLLADASLGSLPLTLVISAEHDPLRDHGLDLVRALLAAGVSVQGLHVAGAFHAYDRFAPHSALAHQFRQALDDFIDRPPPVAADW